MKKIIALLFIVAPALAGLHAQTAALKNVATLQMPKTADDDLPGTRGASVAWHPVQKKYYASFAGNQGFPMAVFDLQGKILSSEDLTTLIDTRGLWYDPVAKTIAGNAYDEYGWFHYKLDSKGIPTELIEDYEGMNQPGEHSVGTCNPLTKQILFLSGDKVHFYNNKADVLDSISIHWGLKKITADMADEEDGMAATNYNYTSIVYTGVKGQELGALNVYDKQIELYDIKTGLLTKTLKLPSDATTEASFNFSFANGIYWLFNMDERKWVGYK